MTNVFISYRRILSGTLAQLIERDLKAQGIEVYLDVNRVEGPGDFPTRLLNAIDACDVFVCIVGKGTFESVWVRTEIEHAVKQSKPLIPVFHEEYNRNPQKESVDKFVEILLKHNGVPVLDVQNLYIDESMSRLVKMIKKGVPANTQVKEIHEENNDASTVQTEPMGWEEWMGQYSDRTFWDVGGYESAKEDMNEIVDFLREPEKYERMGAVNSIKGLLLVGPSGIGKTSLCYALAGESGVPTFTIAGSHFIELYSTKAPDRIRQIFYWAKNVAPCLISIDEIDVLSGGRDSERISLQDERSKAFGQILIEMDYLDRRSNVVVCATATNLGSLEALLMRPGRFDRKIVLDYPDYKDRLEIMKMATKGKPLAPDADIDAIAHDAAGLSGSDLTKLANGAAMIASRRNKKTIGMNELLESMARLMKEKPNDR